MCLNEKIKYCRKPIVDDFEKINQKEEKSWRTCISQISYDCRKKLYSYKEYRICDRCEQVVKIRNQGALG